MGYTLLNFIQTIYTQFHLVVMDPNKFNPFLDFISNIVKRLMLALGLDNE